MGSFFLWTQHCSGQKNDISRLTQLMTGEIPGDVVKPGASKFSSGITFLIRKADRRYRYSSSIWPQVLLQEGDHYKGLSIQQILSIQAFRRHRRPSESTWGTSIWSFFPELLNNFWADLTNFPIFSSASDVIEDILLHMASRQVTYFNFPRPKSLDKKDHYSTLPSVAQTKQTDSAFTTIKAKQKI